MAVEGRQAQPSAEYSHSYINIFLVSDLLCADQVC